MSTKVRPDEYFDNVFEFAAVPSAQAWKDFNASKRNKGEKIAGADIEGFQGITTGLIGVYDPGQEPDDFALWDAAKTQKFLVNATEAFTASVAWGSLAVTLLELQTKEVYFIHEASGGWVKYLSARAVAKGAYESYLETTTDSPVKSEAAWSAAPAPGAAGANGTATVDVWVDGNYGLKAQARHNGVWWEAVGGATTGQEPGVSPVWTPAIEAGGLDEEALQDSLIDIFTDNELVKNTVTNLPLITYSPAPSYEWLGGNVLAKAGDSVNVKVYNNGAEDSLIIYDRNGLVQERYKGIGSTTLTDINYTFEYDGQFLVFGEKSIGGSSVIWTQAETITIVPKVEIEQFRQNLEGFKITKDLEVYQDRGILDRLNGILSQNGFFNGLNVFGPYTEGGSYIKSWMNVPLITGNGERIRKIEITYKIGNGILTALLGIKDGTYTVLTKSVIESNPLYGTFITESFLLDDYDQISVCGFMSTVETAFNVTFFVNDSNGLYQDVKEYIDKKANIQNSSNRLKIPTSLIRLDFETRGILPVAKGTVIDGIFTYTHEGVSLTKFAKLEVQGAGSVVHPMKNFTFGFFKDEARTIEDKIKLGNLIEHEELVFKANYFEYTNARNLVANRIWEDVVQCRNFPKRENEFGFNPTTTTLNKRFPTGALCHVEGYPCELYVNGEFYGIGNFNIGKKRSNYDLSKNNQNHIQIAAETYANLESYVDTDWEIRNPKEPDLSFVSKIAPWFADNALTGSAFKTAFPNHHDVRNMTDVFLFSEFVMATDMYNKNFLVTSWDGGNMMYVLPYDLDTTFGLQFNGLSLTGTTRTCREVGLWDKFYLAYTIEVKARYAELKAKGVFTAENVYNKFMQIASTFGLKKYEEMAERWPLIPSNNLDIPGTTPEYGTGCLTSVAQVMDFIQARIAWMDSHYV